MVIKNGFVFGEDQKFTRRDLCMENGVIVQNGFQGSGREEIDASGLYVLPGLMDVHSHGAYGCDFSDGDPEGLRRILRYEKAHGITSYCPTGMTLPRERLKKIFASVNSVSALPGDEDPSLARIAGIHMEGPFLSAEKKGAHAADYLIPPAAAFFRECNESCGRLIKLVTLAPDTEGALEFIRELRGETNISLGHTAAGYDAAKAAFDAGANHVTHLYNAMPPFGHREPGLIGAAAESSCMAELISDGIHVHASVIRATFKLFPDRVVLISDSMRATGLEDGTYDLGGQAVSVRGKRASLFDGTIAGSATNLYDCMKAAISFGIPKEEAIAAATMNPAKSIGIYGEVGSLTPGKRADVLLADARMNLVRVL
ncbi:MAG: N-acetylglucosamine-6-phosphate deacetylase [Clostridium sp.]|nr:N-acetylglucosamine-6-phosphate deacetylase [Clostridium sp.]